MTYTVTTKAKSPKAKANYFTAKAVLQPGYIYENVIVDSPARPVVKKSRYQQEIDAVMKLSHSAFSSIETEDYDEDPIW